MTETKESKDEPKKEGKVCKDGDVACVHYTGSLESGEVFDSSKDKEPLEFQVGSGQLIKGFDKAVVDMKVGDKKKLLLDPADAYGDKDEKRIQNVPRDMLPKEPDPQPGMMLTIKAPTGQMFPAKIEKVDGDMVTIDFNHPLAGKKLNFEIELVDIKDKKDCDKDCGCGCSH